MVERRDEDRSATFVPPTPENIKPKGSRDNAVEMAAGGTHERKALEAQREKMADPGRTDNPHGTGVGYAGEGSAAYGEQEETMSRNDTPKRADDKDTANAPRRQPEQQQHQQSTGGGHKPGTGGGSQGSQQSTGSVPPTQGAGSTAQSHTPRPSTAETDTSGATTYRSTEGTPRHSSGGGSATGEHTTGSSTPSQGGVAQAQQKASEVKDQAQTKLTEVKSQAQGALDGVKEQAQGKLDSVTNQAQDTLEGVKASLQTKSDQLKETVLGKTDQMKETVSGKTDQWVGTVGEKGDQVKQVANERSTLAGDKLTGLAGTLREKSQTIGADSTVANVATRAAGALEQTGNYLQESTPDDWMSDLKQLISRKPIESVLVAAGLGYMAARALRK